MHYVNSWNLDTLGVLTLLVSSDPITPMWHRLDMTHKGVNRKNAWISVFLYWFHASFVCGNQSEIGTTHQDLQFKCSPYEILILYNGVEEVKGLRAL